MLFFFIYESFSKVFETCELESYDGLVLSKFYRESCPHCQRITPLINEIDQRLNQNNIKINIRNVECQKCDCSKDWEIDAVPTVILTKDKKEIGRFRGYHDYEEIVDFMVKHLKIDKSVLLTNRLNEAGKILQFTEKDFYSGFSGPWLILFYNKEDDKSRALFKEVLSFYGNKINLAEVHESQAKNIEFKYGITKYPTIFAIYDGIFVEYRDPHELDSIIDYVDNFISPSFEEVDLSKFEEISSSIKPIDSIFVVFYQHLNIANSIFKQTAHEFKLKIQIYKTKNKKLFEKAGIFPKSKEDDRTIRDTETIVFAVYRNGIFHRYDGDIDDQHQLYSWIFHAHYPYLTRIDYKTFDSIFHGYKPSVLLVTRGEVLGEAFEKFSESMHLGMPFSDFIYAMLDITQYSDLSNHFLPKINVPSIVVFEPFKKIFHSTNIPVNAQNLEETARKTMRLYGKGKLERYPHKSYMARRVIFILSVVCFVWFLSRRRRSVKLE